MMQQPDVATKAIILHVIVGMFAAHLRVNGLDLCLRLCDRRSRRQSSNDEIAAPVPGFRLIIGKRKGFPDFRTLAKLSAVAEVEKLKRKIKTGGHHADNGEIFAIEKKLHPDDLRITINPALPETRADDDNIVAANRAFFRLEDSASDGRNTKQRQHSCGHAGAGNALGPVFTGEIETRVPERAELFKTVRARLVVDEFRRRDGNPVEILRFEMLQKQDELLRISIRQWPNKQGIDQT